MIWYRCIESDPDTFFRLDTRWDNDPEFALTDAAENFYHDHDGWECDWPRTFSLHKSEGGEEWARGLVDMESRPCFSAYEIKVAADDAV